MLNNMKHKYTNPQTLQIELLDCNPVCATESMSAAGSDSQYNARTPVRAGMLYS